VTLSCSSATSTVKSLDSLVPWKQSSSPLLSSLLRPCRRRTIAQPPTSNSSMTEAQEHTPTVAASAPEPLADQIRYLTPTPPGFAPEYDYVALIQSICDTADFATTESSDTSPPQLLRERQRAARYSSCQACFTESSGSTEYLRFISSQEQLYEQIQYVRRKLTEKPQGVTRVLVIDDIDDSMLQVVGAAIDLDPTFLWRHFNNKPDADINDLEMATLQNTFFSLVAAGRSRRSGTDAGQETRVSPKDGDRGVHVSYRPEYVWHDSASSFRSISSRISCLHCSENNCR
jgi:hypothetical protein